MNLRSAIFVSVASAGVVATGWLGGTAAGPLLAPAAATSFAAPTSFAAALPDTHGATGAAVAMVDRRALVSGSPLQLVGGPDYAAADYPRTLQSTVDGEHA